MSLYYCHKCAKELGEIDILNLDNTIGTDYQFEKFLKHNFPTRIENIHSVFENPSLAKYSQYVANTSASGCLEIDDFKRRNLVFVAGETTGFTFVNGELYRPDNAVRLVFHNNMEKFHAFSTSGSVVPKNCQRCGCLIAF